MKYLFLCIGIISLVNTFGLGIDWGSEFHKSTMLLPKKGFVMVENRISKRKTPSLLSFCDRERFFENDSLMKFNKNVCNTFFYMNRFWDASSEDLESIKEDMKNHYYEDYKVSVDETGFKIESSWPEKIFGKNEKNENHRNYLRPEEIFAMMLEVEKKNAEKTGDTKFKNAVFTIPDNNLSILSRKRIGSAIKLGGLQTLSFVHENTAAAGYFLLDKNFEEKPIDENILIINVGSSSSKLSFIKIQMENEKKRELTVIKDFTFKSFSGYKLDMCLANIALGNYNKVSKKNYKLDELPKNKIKRLYLEVKKIKETLTVNKEINLYMEDFLDDKNLNVKMTRDDYEEKCKYLFDDFKNNLNNFKDSIEKNHKISSVEAIGGVTKTPALLNIIFNETKHHAGLHINFEEGSAHGSAHIAASYVPGIRLKELIINDGPNYDFHFSIFENNSKGNIFQNESILFPVKTNYGTLKKYNFSNVTSNLLICINQKEQKYEVSYELENLTSILKELENKNVKDFLIDLEIELTRAGLVRVKNANLSYTEIVKEKVKINSADHKKDDTSKKDLKEETTTNDTKTESTEEKKAEEIKEEYQDKPYNRLRSVKVSKYYESIKVLSDFSEQFKESEKLLSEANRIEEELAQKSKIKNGLESLQYKLKNEANDKSSNKFLQNDEISKFLETSNELETYLMSSDIKTSTLENLKYKLKQAEDVYEIYNYRKREFNDRENTINLWKGFMTDANKQMTKVQKDRTWINKDVLEEALLKIEKISSSVNALQEELEKSDFNMDPVFNKQVAYDKSQEITKIVNDILAIKKPVEKKEAATNTTSTKTETPKSNTKDEKTPSLDELEEMIKKLNGNGKGDMSKEKLEEMLKNLKDIKKTTEDIKSTTENKEENSENSSTEKASSNIKEDL